MCGIAICLSTDPNLKTEFAQNAIKQLQHRGPDGNGIWMDDNITLVHTRLSILDTSDAGSQPMASLDGRFVISYNGEIYNHLELRKRFLSDVKFRGHSDTETVLLLYERLGENMLQYMIGMWAFAIWDTKGKRLFISRDRYGQKPLYYRKVKGALFFSSEIGPLLKITNAKETTTNLLAISEYLALGNYEHMFEQTFITELQQIIPGTYASIDPRNQEMNQEYYWKLEEVPFVERLPFDEVRRKTFRYLVDDAIHSQLLSDVPVGATVSGGLDSSIIVSSIAAAGCKHFPVFTAQFPDSKFDESQYVRSLKKKWGDALDIHYVPVTGIKLERDLPEVIRQQEEPFGDPSIIAHSFLVSAAKEAKVPVLLGGQGGDELTMGYSWMYQRVFAYAMNNGDIKSFLRFIRNEKIPLNMILRLLLAGGLPSVEHNLRMYMRRHQKSKLVKTLQLSSPINSFGKANEFNGIYKESLKTVGIPHLCHYDDRSTMTQSIEGRMPFLDHRLMEYVATLQPNSFYKNGYSKHIFRETFKDILPKEVCQRKDKIGFYTPHIDLVYKSANWIKDQIMNQREGEFFNSNYLAVLISNLSDKTLTSGMAIDLFRAASISTWIKQKIN